ncbi:serine aminopeptidase domain-containing protein [Thalassospira xiamenensis]|uniref:serine aminopeptidase domain-containing protein n=1 Tax=Thalassospira xiamenensis TaxID=220697 RepID=UPI003AA7F3F7
MALLSLSLLSACQTLTAEGAYRQADEMAAAVRWSAAYAETPHFTLKSYLAPQRVPERPMVIYIEGDGFAWVDGNWVSPDPTPRDPFMLRVALQDGYYNAAYLARPCQYVIETGHGANCQTALWTDARFNQVVIADMSQAIDQILARRPHLGVVLVGGSGGGTVAMLLAARRNDITAVVTLASLLDHRAWTNFHKISPLDQSLNPADFYTKIADIPQLHFLAEEDDVIPVQLSRHELLRLKALSPQTVSSYEIEGIDHSCCWSEYWTAHYRYIIDSLLETEIQDGGVPIMRAGENP